MDLMRWKVGRGGLSRGQAPGRLRGKGKGKGKGKKEKEKGKRKKKKKKKTTNIQGPTGDPPPGKANK